MRPVLRRGRLPTILCEHSGVHRGLISWLRLRGARASGRLQPHKTPRARLVPASDRNPTRANVCACRRMHLPVSRQRHPLICPQRWPHSEEFGLLKPVGSIRGHETSSGARANAHHRCLHNGLFQQSNCTNRRTRDRLMDGGRRMPVGRRHGLQPRQVPDSVPDHVHFAALWCSLVLEAKELSQASSARCTFMHFGAIASAGF